MPYSARYICTILAAAVLLALVVSAAALLAVVVSASASASAAPYGPNPSAWNRAPDGAIKLAPGATAAVPRAATELDCWRGTRKPAGYRLRQRPTRDGYSFTTARSTRTIIGYVRVNRDLFSFAKQRTVCYWWAS